MSRLASTIIASLLCSSGIVTAADAPSNPNISGAVQSLQTSVTALQTTLIGIQTTLNALTPVQSNVRVTPPMYILAQDALCMVTNVGTSAHTVRIEFIGIISAGINTGETQPHIFKTADRLLTPGNGTSLPFTSGAGDYYCKFTVLDGTRADIRAAIMQLKESIGSALTTDVALAAE
jgi:archaellum component FlaF (FlaF/FlaG flagellin family)